METKFHVLQPWLHEVLETIRRDIKTDYLPGSQAFYRQYFGNRPQNRLTGEEIQDAFIRELLKGDEEMAAWVVNRWVFKHGDLYTHFADRLSQISADFGSLMALTPEQSEQILRGAKDAFGAKNVYFFSVLNDVVFPSSVLLQLRKDAEAEGEPKEEAGPSHQESIERLQKEVAKLTEKYEQKLAGVMKKYTADVEALKNQVRALQKKLSP